MKLISKDTTKVSKVKAEQIKARIEDLKNRHIQEQQILLDQLTREEREIIGNPIKEIYNLTKFMANGVQYVIRDTLTVKRFKEFENLQAEVGYGVDFYNMFSNLSKAYNYMNAGKMADASVVLHSMMHGIKHKLDDRENPILVLCTLFICTEDEDVRFYDKAKGDKKIEDWIAEGISMESFFQLAFSLVNGFTPALRKVSLSILAEGERIIKEAKAETNKKSLKD